MDLFAEISQSEYLTSGIYVMYIPRSCLRCIGEGGGFIPCQPSTINDFFSIKYDILRDHAQQVYLEGAREVLPGDKYLCNFSGNCEGANRHNSQSSESCATTCTSQENKDLVYEIMMYAPDRALDLAPSDQVIVIKRLTGANVPPEYAHDAILSITEDSYAPLCYHPELTDYARGRFTDPIVALLGEVRYVLGLEFNIEEISDQVQASLVGVEKTAKNVSETATMLLGMVEFERQWFIVNTIVRGHINI